MAPNPIGKTCNTPGCSGNATHVVKKTDRRGHNMSIFKCDKCFARLNTYIFASRRTRIKHGKESKPGV